MHLFPARRRCSHLDTDRPIPSSPLQDSANMSLHDLLVSRYLDALKDVDLSYLDRQHPDAKSRPVPKGVKAGLSGLFLPSVPEQLSRARHRIMVVGRETAEWNVLRHDEAFVSLPAYIKKAMDKHRKFFTSSLGKKDTRGCTFFNFMRAIQRRCGGDGLIYSNLFCFDWNKGSPMRQKEYFPIVEKYSERLLKAQIEVLKPHIVIFANGMTSVASLRKFFPIAGKDVVCANGRDYADQGVRKSQLWRFDLYDDIQGFRIHHPSARSCEAAHARGFLINLLPAQRT